MMVRLNTIWMKCFWIALCFPPPGFGFDSTIPVPRNDSASVKPLYTEIAFRMDTLFKSLYIQEGFNGNVLVAHEGDVVYKGTFGFADLERKTPLNIESVFEIGSITKQFTAMAIMILYDQGKLDFHDPVQRFIPKFPYKTITIHQLLSHRSGLPEYMQFARKYWKNPQRFMDNNDLMNMIIHRRPALRFSPDETFSYSNTGYIVLACIIERISGKSYAEFLEQNILKQLGMKRTFVFNKKKLSSMKYATQGYSARNRRAVEDYLSGTVGDKGIYSTIEDMLRWDQGLYTEQIVRQATLREAFTPFSFDSKNENNYGYGWRILSSHAKEKVVYHGGLWRGYSSLFIRRLSDRLSVIVLCNKVDTSYEDIGRLIGIIDSSKQVFPIPGGS